MTCLVRVDLVEGRHRCTLRSGLLRAQRLHGPDDHARVALVATTALLLGGDAVRTRVEVGPGAWLDLHDVAGTVAYDGQGQRATWSVEIDVAEGGTLRWRGEPLVVADGADVRRASVATLADDATLLLREALVLGRTGQVGGSVRVSSRIDRGGRPLLVEEQHFDPAGRQRPGLLGEARVIDSLLAVGPRVFGRGTSPRPPGGAATYALPDGHGTLTRFLGRELAASNVPDHWARLTEADR